MVPEQFGPYRLEKLLGRGGMGEVYRAIDVVKERTVALKRLPAHLAADADFQARFRREAKVAAQLRQANIIPIHDFGEIDGRLFIDMRLVEGSDLAAQLTEYGAMPPERALDIVEQVAAALDAAHAAGLVHRDIKPANVLLAGGSAGSREFVYVVDFGIARSVAGSGQVSLTATGATIGTIDYMAPERFLHGGGDHRVDIYALGCVLHEALAGAKPFPGDELLTLMYAHVNTAPPRPSENSPDVPPTMDEVIACAMAKDPERRYQSAGALAAAARAALATAATPPAEPVPSWKDDLRLFSGLDDVFSTLFGPGITRGLAPRGHETQTPTENATPSTTNRDPDKKRAFSSTLIEPSNTHLHSDDQSAKVSPPTSLILSVGLQMALALFGIIGMVVLLVDPDPDQGRVYLILIAMVAYLGCLIFAARGQNWARFIVAAFIIVFVAARMIEEMPHDSPHFTAQLVGAALLVVASTVPMFTPSANEFFRARRQRP